VHEPNTVSGGPNDGTLFDYYVWAGQLSGAFDYVSVGDCGVFDGYLFDPTLANTTTTFFCNAGLFQNDSNTSPTRSELQIDAKDAYPPYVAEQINPDASGLPAVSYTYSLDPATGNLTIHETDPLVKCTDTSYPPDTTKCATFVSAGVTDNITITQDHDGRVSWFTESFASTDTHSHTLDLLWDQNQRFHGSSGDSDNVEYEFPGQSGFAIPTAGSSVTLPATAGTIYIRVHGGADGDMNTGRGRSSTTGRRRARPSRASTPATASSRCTRRAPSQQVARRSTASRSCRTTTPRTSRRWHRRRVPRS
jgi:hypothetical protein